MFFLKRKISHVICALMLIFALSAPVFAGTIANSSAPGPVWYFISASDTTLRYVWPAQSAGAYTTYNTGSWHLYDGYNPQAWVIPANQTENVWNWTTCYYGSGAGSTNTWCRRTI